MAEAILTGSRLLSDCARLLLSLQASTRAAEGGKEDHNGYPKLDTELGLLYATLFMVIIPRVQIQ